MPGFLLSLMAVVAMSILATGALQAAQMNEKVWSTLSIDTNIGKFSYQLEPQLRLIERANIFDQFLGNFGAGYQFSPQWLITLGITSVTTAQTLGTDITQTSGSNIHEMRLWAQTTYTPKQNPKWVMRSRLEQRKLQNFNQLGYRLRERLTFKQPITESISLVISDELFFNLNQTDWITTDTIDQNRIQISIDQKASNILLVGAGYMYQFICSHPRQNYNVAVFYARLTLPEEKRW
ncbi:DUF2490 domain-containing protein [Legionella lansingensis]|nr:DUF2490 domain-containing protein [Legionella lansingensis]